MTAFPRVRVWITSRQWGGAAAPPDSADAVSAANCSFLDRLVATGLVDPAGTGRPCNLENRLPIRLTRCRSGAAEKSVQLGHNRGKVGFKVLDSEPQELTSGQPRDVSRDGSVDQAWCVTD
jgi:hypothetical protein